MRKKSRFPAGMQIQSLVFDANRFSAREARSWASSNGFRAPATERLATTIRLRQKPSRSFDARTFRTVHVGGGVQAVVAVPKKRTARPAKKRTVSRRRGG